MLLPLLVQDLLLLLVQNLLLLHLMQLLHSHRYLEISTLSIKFKFELLDFLQGSILITLVIVSHHEVEIVLTIIRLLMPLK